MRSRIAAAAERSGRAPTAARLLAVTKTVPAEAVRAAVAAGQTLFGENYVQEGKAKSADLPGVEFHLIGHLQRNKAKDAVKVFSLIHTVDSAELARALDTAAEKVGKIQDILLQINISGEGTKSGVPPDELATLAKSVATLAHLRLRGLMCIGTYFEPEAPDDLRRSEFRALRGLRAGLIEALGADLPELSMGMSHDYEQAVEEGATIVRVGTAIFGDRA